jgi:hypothetical protein
VEAQPREIPVRPRTATDERHTGPRTWATDGIKEVSTVVLADGTHFTTEVSAHFDGKDYKFTTHPNLDTAVLKRVNANTLTFTGKKGGKVVGMRKLVVSKNGKLTTKTITLMNARGQTSHNVAVFDKQ